MELKNKKLELEKLENKIQNLQNATNKFISEKIESFPWLALLISEYKELQDEKIAFHLEMKSHPAKKSAEKVREVKKEKKALEQKYRTINYTLNYYESLFPILKEYKYDGLDELAESVNSYQEIDDLEYDPIYDWLSDDEYRELSEQEKYQRALDNYWNRTKTKWQIGKLYERYIGYTYEIQGYSVFYQGIKLKFEDLGIDLICQNEDEILLIQCKYWSQNKLIRENHINQLFGTSVKYALDKHYKNEQISILFTDLFTNYKIKPMLITSTKLSETARNFASALGIILIENKPLTKYPIIKCHISNINSEPIYHLPFDQQYDSTILELDKGEYYVETVKEAEERGFRRAYRWRGTN